MFGLLLGKLITFPFFVIALTIHEYAHSYLANRLGDPTPRVQGRLSLNPLKHLDPLGTIMILFVGFGWAKPVEYDPYNLSNPRRDSGLIAIAGPLSNISLALVLSLIYHFLPIPGLGQTLIVYAIFSNIVLAIFNLVPVHPLDGSKVLEAVLPSDLSLEYQHIMRRYGTIILLMLLLPISGSAPINAIISPAINFLASLLI